VVEISIYTEATKDINSNALGSVDLKIGKQESSGATSSRIPK
jgi:hypothetical protein